MTNEVYLSLDNNGLIIENNITLNNNGSKSNSSENESKNKTIFFQTCDGLKE